MYKQSGLLSGYRALDLTDHKGYLCGKILGDLGVDVIKVEKPGGDPGRRLGPFYQDIPHPEKSLFWFAYNSNKRGITLDLETADGRVILEKLASKSDFLIESHSPGFMAELGLGYESLNRLNPRLVYISITPFGQQGPYSKHKDSDITLMAVSGFLYLIGDPDRPPVQIGYPQSYLTGGLEAAIGAMVAHYHREASGEGQLVDVSIHSSLIRMSGGIHMWWDTNRQNLHRRGSYLGWTSTTLGKGQRVIFKCRDGYFTFALYGGKVGEHSNRELVKWMDQESMAPTYMKEKDWASLNMGTVTQDELDNIAASLDKFFQQHTKAELYHGMLERGIMGYPVADVQDIFQDRQLNDRRYWTEIEHPELGAKITYPGAFTKFSDPDCAINITKRAPMIGEHNLEIYEGELGLTREELLALKQAGVV